MNEEEQFVNIDLNDDNICSVCKLGTDKETLSFCHICFELNIEDSGTNICPESILWPHRHNQSQREEEAISTAEPSVQTQHPHYSREELDSMSLGEVQKLNAVLQQQIQEVFEELTQQVQEKDSLASELHVRHVAIEQLLKNCSKLPCLQVGRAGVKPHLPMSS
ncbi:protein EURL homolog isoform X2 [Tenrec ecaudatus]|uniref:protein EURL homolog isoform X2 n=1 Tax=Tenrec ecaudatus TaxID=94439 RepID=UPI003F59D783